MFCWLFLNWWNCSKCTVTSYVYAVCWGFFWDLMMPYFAYLFQFCFSVVHNWPNLFRTYLPPLVNSCDPRRKQKLQKFFYDKHSEFMYLLSVTFEHLKWSVIVFTLVRCLLWRKLFKWNSIRFSALIWLYNICHLGDCSQSKGKFSTFIFSLERHNWYYWHS